MSRYADTSTENQPESLGKDMSVEPCIEFLMEKERVLQCDFQKKDRIMI